MRLAAPPGSSHRRVSRPINKRARATARRIEPTLTDDLADAVLAWTVRREYFAAAELFLRHREVLAAAIPTMVGQIGCRADTLAITTPPRR